MPRYDGDSILAMYDLFYTVNMINMMALLQRTEWCENHEKWKDSQTRLHFHPITVIIMKIHNHDGIWKSTCVMKVQRQWQTSLVFVGCMQFSLFLFLSIFPFVLCTYILAIGVVIAWSTWNEWRKEQNNKKKSPYTQTHTHAYTEEREK